MTFPARIIPFPEAQLKAGWKPLPPENAEQRWRRACCDFLYAAMHRAPPGELRKLSADIFRWKKRMVDQ
jgi:hypothetical protein